MRVDGPRRLRANYLALPSYLFILFYFILFYYSFHVASWLGLLTNVTSAHIFLDIHRHSWPVVYHCNLIISFSVAAMCAFSDCVVDLTHNIHSQGFRNYQSVISIPVFELY